MNRKVVIGSLIAMFIAVFAYYSFMQIQPPEIENEPDWMVLQDAIDQAAIDNRLILVDIFEVGCQWCRKMNREVYPSPTIRSILDREFHPVKVNGNSDNRITFLGEEITEQAFAAKMGVTAYPFTVVLDSQGNVIDRRRGYMDTQGLSRFLRNALEKNSASASL
jgi:thioredoxin-related protein